MATLWDMIFGGGQQTDPNATTNSSPGFFSDSTGNYLGNMIDPSTVNQFKAARAQEGLLGLGAGLLSLGPSRLPVPFWQSLGAGAQGLLGAQHGLTDDTLKAAQTGSAIADQATKKMDLALAIKQLQLADQRRAADAAGGTPAPADTAAPAATVTPVNLTGGAAGNAPPVSTSASENAARAATVLVNEFGWTPAAAQGALNNMFGESSGVAWGNIGGGGENGLWQFHPKTHLPLFLAASGGDTSPEAQARYMGTYVNKTMPGYGQIDDPQQATGAFLRGFERPKNQSDSEVARRFAYNGQSAAALQNVAGAGNANNPLPPVPNFGGRMAGNEGAAYAPAASAPGAPSVGTVNPPVGRLIMDPSVPNTAAGRAAASPMSQLSANYADAVSKGFRGTIQDYAASGGAQPPVPAVVRAGQQAMTGGGAPTVAPPGAGGTTGGATPGGAVPVPAVIRAGQGAAAAPAIPPGPPQIPAGGQVLPPGFSRQQVADANYAVELARLRKQTPNPIDVKIAGFSLDVALEAAKSNAQEKAKNDFAYSTAYKTASGTKAGEDPYNFTTGTVTLPNGMTVEAPIPTPMYRRMAENQFGQPGAPQPQVAAPQRVAPLPSVPANPGPAPAGVVPPGAAPMATPSVVPGSTMAVGGAGLRSGLGLPLVPSYGPPAAPPAAPAPVTQQAAPMTPPPGTVGKPIYSPGQTRTQEKQAEAGVAMTPYTANVPVGQGPGQDQPKVVSTGQHYFVNPPLSQQDPIRAYGGDIKPLEAEWTKVSSRMADAQQGIQVSRQLLTTMADIFHRVEGGAFTQGLAEKSAALRAIGINPAGNDPGEVQQLIKDNFAASLATMKATGLTRWTQQELSSTSTNFANPNLQPIASFNIIAQDLGKLNQADALTQAWSIARKDGWSDPNSFAEKWYRANPLQSFVDRAKVQIGPFKGMTQEQIKQNIPTHADGPNGKMVLINNQWIPVGN
jgi:hypothetical protein